MKTQKTTDRSPESSLRAFRFARRGFTLLEMVGVLAVIAILAAALIPKVFEAIHMARIDHTAISIATVKTASLEHFAKYGCMPVNGGTAPPTTLTLGQGLCTNFDQVLLAEALMDKPFAVKIGKGSIRLMQALSSTTDPTGGNAAYNLDGMSTRNDAAGTFVVEAVIANVDIEDARALNRIIDGELSNFGEDADGNDFHGRVKYAGPQTNNGNGSANSSGQARALASNGNGASNGGSNNGGGNNGNNGNGNGNGDGTGNSGNNNGNNGNGNGNGTGNGGNNSGNNGGDNGNGTNNGNNGNHYGQNRTGTVEVHVYLVHK